jgi:hypothetical protein
MLVKPFATMYDGMDNVYLLLIHYTVEGKGAGYDQNLIHRGRY